MAAIDQALSYTEVGNISHRYYRLSPGGSIGPIDVSDHIGSVPGNDQVVPGVRCNGYPGEIKSLVRGRISQLCSKAMGAIQVNDQVTVTVCRPVALTHHQAVMAHRKAWHIYPRRDSPCTAQVQVTTGGITHIYFGRSAVKAVCCTELTRNPLHYA